MHVYIYVCVRSQNHQCFFWFSRARRKNKNMEDWEEYRIVPGLDIWRIDGFDRKVLKIDAKNIQKQLEEKYPIKKERDEIEPAKAQWVEGGNDAG